MIIDKLLSPAIKRALADFTVSTQTIVPPGNERAGVMDWGAARNNGLLANPYGPGWDINVRGATSVGAATLGLNLITSAAANLSSPVTLFTLTPQALAALNKFDLFVPMPETDTYLRYIAWQAVVGTAVFTGGTLSIEFVADARKWRAYPSQGNR